MVIEGLELADDGSGWTRHRTRVRGNGRQAQCVDVRVPTNASITASDDATAALPLVLLLAMRRGEDLDVAGRVDPHLYARLDLIQSYYRAMDPTLRFAKMHVAGLLDHSQPPVFSAGACLSRGVDSMYACARGRTARGPIDCAVFVDGNEPLYDAAVRQQELVLTERAAEAIGLPLLVVEAPLRTSTDGTLDWEDAVGAGLAWIAHVVGGGLCRFVVPSTDAIRTLGPCGSSPVLDPLFSSRRMEIEHGDVVATRLEKVDWLVTHKPELLPLLKVSYEENRPDNCGRCRKCLHTMACLRLSGALEQATGFPPSLDLDSFEGLTPPQLSDRYGFAQVHEAAVRVGDRELAAALASMLERTSAAGLTAEPPAETFRTANARLLVTVVRTGHSDPDAIGRGDVGSALSGLLRTLDLRARRHSYTTSGSRAGGLTAELGALITPGCGGQIPVWTLVDGRIVTDRYLPMTSTAGHWARARFCAPPLRSGEHSLMRRVRLTLRRIFDAVLLRPPPPACIPESSGPVGYLFEEPDEARLALWSGVHPVVGDQLLTWSPEAIARAGYEDASLLGYLVAKAPHTGRLGPLSAPLVPWVGAGESVDDGA